MAFNMSLNYRSHKIAFIQAEMSLAMAQAHMSRACSRTIRRGQARLQQTPISVGAAERCEAFIQAYRKRSLRQRLQIPFLGIRVASSQLPASTASTCMPRRKPNTAAVAKPTAPMIATYATQTQGLHGISAISINGVVLAHSAYAML